MWCILYGNQVCIRNVFTFFDWRQRVAGSHSSMARAPLNTDKRFSDAKKRPVSVEYFLLRSLTHVVLTWNSDDGRKARVASTASQQRSASLWLLNDCCRRATTVTVREQNTTTTTSFHKTRDKLHYHTMQVNDIGIWNFQNNSNFIDDFWRIFFSLLLY